MKKFLSLILALGMVASLAGCGGSSSSGDASSDNSSDSSTSAPAASAKLRFVTGGESGTYYAFGSVIAQHATNNTNVAVTGLVGNGSKSNVEELADGNAELAFCQSDVMAYAYNGTNLFEEPIDCFSTVAALYMEDVQIVTTDPSIKTVADLAGKNVSVGAAGSGVYFNAVDILSAYGLGDLDAEDQRHLSELRRQCRLPEGRQDRRRLHRGRRSHHRHHRPVYHQDRLPGVPGR